MNISPANINITAAAPSIAVQTEQAERNNRLRDKIAAPYKMSEKAANQTVTNQDDQHAGLENISAFEALISEKILNEMAADIQSQKEVNSSADHSVHSMSDSLSRTIPDDVLQKIEQQKKIDCTRSVVAMRYEQSSSPNLPSEILIVI